MNNNYQISCIVPTYNAQHLLEKHLPSILKACRSGDEIIICDDASTDKSLEWLTKEFNLQPFTEKASQVLQRSYQPIISASEQELFMGSYVTGDIKIIIKVIKNKRNQRFAAAVNLAVTWADSEALFLINNDVSVTENVLAVVAEQLVSDASIFGIGCLEYESTAKGEKSGKNMLWFDRGIFQHSKAKDFEAGDTAWVSGGSGAFSKSKWFELNGFDTGFAPAYWEDIDLSYRARERGWKVLFNPAAVVYHQHETTHSTVLGSKNMEAISWRNCRKFTWKHATLMQKLQFLLWYPYWELKRIG